MTKTSFSIKSLLLEDLLWELVLELVLVSLVSAHVYMSIDNQNLMVYILDVQKYTVVLQNWSYMYPSTVR